MLVLTGDYCASFRICRSRFRRRERRRLRRIELFEDALQSPDARRQWEPVVRDRRFQQLDQGGYFGVFEIESHASFLLWLLIGPVPSTSTSRKA
jgi:hypothetical protein